MTPQLMQAIKLLQLSHHDLAAYVDGELEKNPLLERPAEEQPVRNETEPADEPPREVEEPRNGDWMEDRLETSRETIEQRLDTGLENVFPDESPAGPVRQSQSEPAAYSEWAGVGAGGRADGDYNLEAFVSEETTLAGHLTEQVALAFSNPAERMIAQYLVDLVDEAGYLTGDLAEAGRQARRADGADRGGAGAAAGPRSAGRVRAQPDRMPRHPVARARPARSRHGGAARQSRAPGQARLRGAQEDLRRRRRRPRRT